MSQKDSSATVKRVRSSNFTVAEENTLVALAVKHSGALECKKTGHNTWGAKNSALKQIQEEFCSLTGNNRGNYKLHFGVDANVNVNKLIQNLPPFFSYKTIFL